MINPKSLENLKPFNEIDTAKHKELSSKGGKASGETRRKQKRLWETFKAYSMYLNHREEFESISRTNAKQINKAIKKLENI